MTTRVNRRCLNKTTPWRGPPSLDEVMELLHNEFKGEYHKGWLDDEDALIKFKKNKRQGEPLRNFLFTRINIESSGAYIFYYGTWMEMSAHYLYNIEKDFVGLLSKQILKRSKLPWLLPWKKPFKENNEKNQKRSFNKGTEKRNKCTEYDIERSKPLWQNHFKNICCRDEPFNQVCIETEKLRREKVSIINYGTLMKKSLVEIAGNLYHHLECSLNEPEYNKLHTLFNKICQNYNHRMRIIVCDKIVLHNIELCDILMFNDDTTYIVHVKKQFLLQSISVVCTQIRNSADQIYHNQSCGTGLIKRYWEKLTQHKRLESMNVREFQDLFKLHRKIVFVLACRDTRQVCDFIDDVRNRVNLQVKITDTIRNEFKADYGETIIAKLMKKRYLSKKGELTNQFILDRKSKKGKDKFLKVMLSSKCVKDENDANKLKELLSSGLSKSSSTGAKMEIIRLAQYFEAIGKKNFKFRIYSICHDFESIDDKIMDGPALRVIDDSSDDEEGKDDEPDENFPSSSKEKSRKLENTGDASKYSIKSSSHEDKRKRSNYYSSRGKEGKASSREVDKKPSEVTNLAQQRRHIQKTRREDSPRTNDQERIASKDGGTLESKYPKQPPKVQQQPTSPELLKKAVQNTKEKPPVLEFRPPKRIEERPRSQEDIDRRKRADTCNRRRKEGEISDGRRESANRKTLLGSANTSPQKEASQSTNRTSTLKLRNTPKPDDQERIGSKDGGTLESKYPKQPPKVQQQPTSPELLKKAVHNTKDKPPVLEFRPPKRIEERPQTQEEIDRRKRADACERRRKEEEISDGRRKSANRKTLIGSPNTSPQKEASQSTNRTSTLKLRNTPKPDCEERIANKDGMTLESKYNKQSPNDEKQPFDELMNEIKRRTKEVECEYRRTEERRKEEEMMERKKQSLGKPGVAASSVSKSITIKSKND